MDWYDWLLLLHVLAAFAMVASTVVFTALTVALWRVDRPSTALGLFRIGRPAGVLVVAGAVGTLVFGIWLAIYVDGYELWDAWIAAALVLWLVNGGTGDRVGKHYTAARKHAERLLQEGNDVPNADLASALRAQRPVVLHVITVAALLAILVLMIFKPGA